MVVHLVDGAHDEIGVGGSLGGPELQIHGELHLSGVTRLHVDEGGEVEANCLLEGLHADVEREEILKERERGGEGFISALLITAIYIGGSPRRVCL